MCCITFASNTSDQALIWSLSEIFPSKQILVDVIWFVNLQQEMLNVRLSNTISVLLHINSSILTHNFSDYHHKAVSDHISRKGSKLRYFCQVAKFRSTTIFINYKFLSFIFIDSSENVCDGVIHLVEKVFQVILG